MMLWLLAAGNPLDHVLPHKLGDWHLFGLTIEVNNMMLMQAIATTFCLLLLGSAFSSYRRSRGEGDIESLVPRGFGNAVESICTYLRDQVAKPVLEEHTDRFMPYVWSAFFFILFCNLFGLLPVDAVTGLFGVKTHLAATATGCIWVTATLAICTLLMMVVNGLRYGGVHYLAHYCPGPVVLAPLLIPVEILGLLAKIFALTVRLFANMMAGHILLAVLVGFATAGSGLLGVGIAIPAVLGAAAITGLELFVAFLQAFIFTFLTCVFIGGSVNVHHGEDYGEAHDHSSDHAMPHAHMH